MWNGKARSDGCPRWGKERGRERQQELMRGEGARGGGGSLWKGGWESEFIGPSRGRSGPLVTNEAICRHTLRPTRASGAAGHLSVVSWRGERGGRGTVCLTMEHWEWSRRRGHKQASAPAVTGARLFDLKQGSAGELTGIQLRSEHRRGRQGPGCDEWAAATWPSGARGCGQRASELRTKYPRPTLWNSNCG